jgi:hypothetical protein
MLRQPASVPLGQNHARIVAIIVPLPRGQGTSTRAAGWQGLVFATHLIAFHEHLGNF